jgi:hypothetical protein
LVVLLASLLLLVLLRLLVVSFDFLVVG